MRAVPHLQQRVVVPHDGVVVDGAIAAKVVGQLERDVIAQRLHQLRRRVLAKQVNVHVVHLDVRVGQHLQQAITSKCVG